MRRVLVPLDGSRLAESILPDARRLAGPSGQLVLMRDATAADGEDAAGAEDYLERLAQSLRSPDLSVETHTMTGDPAVAIDVGAQAYRSDIIALATHGRSQAQRNWWGSVAWRAALRSPVPVLLRHAEQDGTQEEAVTERRIMVPLDGSDLAEKALPLAGDLAREWDAQLWLVRVISSAEDEPEVARQYLGRVAEHQGGDAHDEVLVGPAVESLAGAVNRLGITDVVMTSHGRTGVSRAIVGEVADNLIQRLHCPVMVIPSLFT